MTSSGGELSRFQIELAEVFFALEAAVGFVVAGGQACWPVS